MTATWTADVLGSDYQALSLDLGVDDEGPVVATLVRYRPSAAPAAPAADARPTTSGPGDLGAERAVLYVHGWSDYFFQTELAEFFHGQGARFYALDLRKYGRSLRPYQTPGYIERLGEYDADLAAAMAVIRDDLGDDVRVVYMGHSTGGLIGALWAEHNPGEVCALVLNSPWLELQGSAVLRNVSTPAVSQLARFQPKTPLPNIDPGYYARTIGVTGGGEWTVDPQWRPTPAFPVRAGWLRAIIAGHAEVARGLSIDVPILTLAATHSLFSARWSEAMRSADTVLDVEVIVRRAVQLGPVVTVVRIADGVHDLTLSPEPVRTHLYAELARWLLGYGWVERA
ncbi:alpha/beta hydrolase [Pengzhenrongella sicca]|uniref:Alpha/beta hydrolase n=1 Tax=Pengzhenrongella sicca TaxID=2819238 RepID=A0A8A4ZEP0_9MICO|nr:alpha/beta hydrolase [Pengzhenrongella sicca]QTE29775.1 alpha/beta hydrolase [Pengzhenrongella sicca]